MKELNEEKKAKYLADWKEYRENYQWPVQHWRAWGSWFSWGSPVGLGIFIALSMLSIGAFIWLINL
jgi:hypothetical protein